MRSYTGPQQLRSRRPAKPDAALRAVAPATVTARAEGIGLACLLLLAAGFAAIQILIGGTRLAFALPPYAIFGLAAVVALWASRKSVASANRSCLIACGGFAAYIVLRAISSPSPYYARADLYLVLAAAAVYLVTATALTSASGRIRLLAFLLILALVHVAVGFVQFRDMDNFMPVSFLQRADYGQRASGLYICPNHLAGLLEVLGVFGLSLTCWSRWPVWRRIITGYLTLICYVGLIMTGSRGGYLSASFSLFVFAALSFLLVAQNGKVVFQRASAAVCVAILIVGLGSLAYVRSHEFLKGRTDLLLADSSFRYDAWSAAVKQWQLSPLIGTGSGTHRFYGREFRAERMQADPIDVHNDYLHLLCEYGIVGGVALLAFLGFHLRQGWRNFQSLGPKRVSRSGRLRSHRLALQLGALCALAALGVHSMVDFNLHIPANALLLAFVFGVVANPGAARGASHTAPGRKHFLPRVLTGLLGLLLLVQTMRLLPGEYFAERARSVLRDEDPAAAVALAARGLRFDDGNPELFFYQGRGLVALGYQSDDFDTSSAYYERALQAFGGAHKLAPQELGFTLDLALTYDLLGRYHEAEILFRNARSLDPRSHAVGQFYQAHLERWEGAAKELALEDKASSGDQP